MQFSYWELRNIDDAAINDNLRAVWDSNPSLHERYNVTGTEEGFASFAAELAIPWFFGYLRFLCPLSSVVSLLIVVSQLHHFATAGSRRADLNGRKWEPTDRENMVMLVITMPLVYQVMALCSTDRMLNLMTGQAVIKHPGMSWEKVETIQLAAYLSDLELASAFQFFTVFEFARLCGSFLGNSRNILPHISDPEVQSDIRTVLKWAAIQGVFAYVLVGFVRCVINFGVALLLQMQQDDARVFTDKVEEKLQDKIKTVFSVVTILCVVNMKLICKLKDVKTSMGNANLKFQGTRLLLLIAQVQSQVIEAFTVDAKMYKVVQEKSEQYDLDLHVLSLSQYQARLLHVALLSIECLAVVLFNRIVWRLNKEQMGSLMESNESNMKTGLLSS